MRTIKRDIVGAFIFSKDSKLLLGHGGVYKGMWVVPGGGVEPNETNEQAVKREILEETGIDIQRASVERVDIGELSGSSEKNLRDTGERVLVEMNFINFKVKLPSNAEDIELTIEDDFVECKWFGLKELKNIKMSPPTVISLQKMGYLD